MDYNKTSKSIRNKNDKNNKTSSGGSISGREGGNQDLTLFDDFNFYSGNQEGDFGIPIKKDGYQEWGRGKEASMISGGYFSVQGGASENKKLENQVRIKRKKNKREANSCYQTPKYSNFIDKFRTLKRNKSSFLQLAEKVKFTPINHPSDYLMNGNSGISICYGEEPLSKDYSPSIVEDLNFEKNCVKLSKKSLQKIAISHPLQLFDAEASIDIDLNFDSDFNKRKKIGFENQKKMKITNPPKIHKISPLSPKCRYKQIKTPTNLLEYALKSVNHFKKVRVAESLIPKKIKNEKNSKSKSKRNTKFKSQIKSREPNFKYNSSNNKRSQWGFKVKNNQKSQKIKQLSQMVDKSISRCSSASSSHRKPLKSPKVSPINRKVYNIDIQQTGRQSTNSTIGDQLYNPLSYQLKYTNNMNQNNKSYNSSLRGIRQSSATPKGDIRGAKAVKKLMGRSNTKREIRLAGSGNKVYKRTQSIGVVSKRVQLREIAQKSKDSQGGGITHNGRMNQQQSKNRYRQSKINMAYLHRSSTLWSTEDTANTVSAPKYQRSLIRGTPKSKNAHSIRKEYKSKMHRGASHYNSRRISIHKPQEGQSVKDTYSQSSKLSIYDPRTVPSYNKIKKIPLNAPGTSTSQNKFRFLISRRGQRV